MQKMLKTADLAERLGVCPRTIYTYLKKGMIPHIKVTSKLILVSEQDFEQFLSERKTIGREKEQQDKKGEE